MKNGIKYLALYLSFQTIAYANIIQGVGLQVATGGTGVYYKPGIEINDNSKVSGEMGMYLRNNYQNVSIFNLSNTNNSIYLNLACEYSKELYQNMIVGMFIPIITINGGGITDINSFSKNDYIGIWKINYSIGAGFQFYNVQTINELTLIYNNNPFSKGNIAFQLAMYWV